MKSGKPSPSGTAHRNTVPISMRIPHMPMEWLDSSCWRLPSGKALVEFALQAGFLAPLLFQAHGPAGRPRPKPAAQKDRRDVPTRELP